MRDSDERREAFYKERQRSFRRYDSILEKAIQGCASKMAIYEKEEDWDSFYFWKEDRDKFIDLRKEFKRLFDQETDYGNLEQDIFVDGLYVPKWWLDKNYRRDGLEKT